MMFGTMLPIWAVVLVEFVFAYTLEVPVGSPLSFRIASKMFDIKTTHPVIFEGAVITVTVAIICPAMSFIAAVIYYPFLKASMLSLYSATGSSSCATTCRSRSSHSTSLSSRLSEGYSN